MSHAFVRDGDDIWLHDIAPTMIALINYLARENGGLKITEKERHFDPKLKLTVHKMSDGFSYAVRDNKWTIVD